MNPENISDRILEQLSGAFRPQVAGEIIVPPPPSIPNHELLHRIGSGSYGDVWVARGVTGALRAVKVVWKSCFASDRPYEREFQGIVAFEPISRSHPGVISILHVGRGEGAGCFFYVMELADDAEADGTGQFHIPRTLRHDLKTRGRLPVTDVLTLGVQLADALGHLHRHGLVHRDVKPSNVVYVDGHSKLADIGLVTNRDESLSFVGTEGFIPPEGQGSARADIFSLGRLLYEAATGFDRCDFPALPDDLDRWPPAERGLLLELNEVLTRMCAPDVSRRQENAAAVAGDLNLILAGRSVRRAYGVERRLKWATRASAAAVGISALAGGALWFMSVQQRHSELRASLEHDLRQRAETAERESRRQLYSALFQQARATRLNRQLGQRVSTLEAVRHAATIANTAELRREAVAALALPDLRLLREIPFDLEEHGRVFDPGFAHYAVCRERGPVEVRLVADDALTASLPASSNLKAFFMKWSPDGRFLAVKRDHDATGDRADLEVWDVASRSQILFFSKRMCQQALSFHPREPKLIFADADGKATIWNLNTFSVEREFRLNEFPMTLAYSPDGTRFSVASSGSESHGVEVRDAESGTVMFTERGAVAYRAEWHPSGQMIVLPDIEGNIRLLNLETGTKTLLGRHKAQAVTAVFHPEGRFLVTGGWEAELICWDLLTMRRAFDVGLNSWLFQISQDGRQCAVEMADRVHTFEFQTPDCVRELPTEAARDIYYAAFSGDGRWLATNRHDGLALWDLNHPDSTAGVTETKTRIPFFAPSTGDLFAYSSGALQRWKIVPGNANAAPRLESLPAFSPTGLLCAAAREEELVIVRQDGIRFLRTDYPQAEFVRHVPHGGGESIALSADGRWLSSHYSQGPELRVYKMPEMKRVATLVTASNIWTNAFSPSGLELAVGTELGLEVYDTEHWQRTRVLAIDSERQSRLLYSPDGKSLWHASDGRTTILRDAHTLEALLPLPEGWFLLSLNAAGDKLAVRVDASRVQIWDLPAVRRNFMDLGIGWDRAVTTHDR